MYKLCFYVPESHLEAVKQAVFDAGAGRMGDYEHCCWQVLGQGQFRPGSGANPFIGEAGRLEQVAEYRVEMVCEDEAIQQAVAALRQAHPYEEPAFDVWPLLELQEADNEQATRGWPFALPCYRRRITWRRRAADAVCRWSTAAGSACSARADRRSAS